MPNTDELTMTINTLEKAEEVERLNQRILSLRRDGLSWPDIHKTLQKEHNAE